MSGIIDRRSLRELALASAAKPASPTTRAG
jgi:hypothetical protein